MIDNIIKVAQKEAEWAYQQENENIRRAINDQLLIDNAMSEGRVDDAHEIQKQNLLTMPK